MKMGAFYIEKNIKKAEFDFGTAISFLKEGLKVARKGWNGKGMFIYLVRGSKIAKCDLYNEAAKHLYNGPSDSTPVSINSHIDMKAADDSIVVGWLASQTDMLAEDWLIIE